MFARFWSEANGVGENRFTARSTGCVSVRVELVIGVLLAEEDSDCRLCDTNRERHDDKCIRPDAKKDA